MASPTPEERAARALPCEGCPPPAKHAPVIGEHWRECPQGYRPAVAAAIREAEADAWRRGAEAMQEALALDMHALAEVAGDFSLRRDFAWKAAAQLVERMPVPLRPSTAPTPPADPT